MMVKCVSNEASSFPEYLGEAFFELSLRFQLTVGDLYPVAGMELVKGRMWVLVPDDSDFRRPQWLPLDLFTVDDSALPSWWYFRRYDKGSAAFEAGFQARWGYKQLVESDQHRNDLEDLDPAALYIFSAELAQVEASSDDDY